MQLLVFCEPGDANALWRRFVEDLSEDLRHAGLSPQAAADGALQHVSDLLLDENKGINALKRKINVWKEKKRDGV